MEHLPVEVIGNILSHLGTDRDVVVSSTTCQKWREAYKKYLHTLSFKFDDWPRDISTRQLEILIKQTILQTKGLQRFSIHTDSAHTFAVVPFIAWVMYTRKTLRSLYYNGDIMQGMNVVEHCSRRNLEVLDLDHHSIIRVEPSYLRFTCLKFLSLRHVIISALDLSILFTVCPRIESLTLLVVQIVTSDSQSSMELSCPTLKCISARLVSVVKIILEAENLECLHLYSSNLDFFELSGQGTLKHLKIDDYVSVTHLKIGENLDNLKVVDVSYFMIILPKFYQMIFRASKLRALRLWGVPFKNIHELIDAESIAVSFPELKHLALKYDIRDGLLHKALQGSSTLEKVNVLELGWTSINDNFGHWVFGMIGRCPNLKKLVIHGALAGEITYEECKILGNVTTFVFGFMRKYIHVDVQFVFT